MVHQIPIFSIDSTLPAGHFLPLQTLSSLTSCPFQTVRKEDENRGLKLTDNLTATVFLVHSTASRIFSRVNGLSIISNFQKLFSAFLIQL
jgi:hypothetical protein